MHNNTKINVKNHRNYDVNCKNAFLDTRQHECNNTHRVPKILHFVISDEKWNS